ncbi:hypothetical protein ABIB25_001693 [Nakamurella sp. UYEF19]|uniref:DUF4287 domain-containing protein n=1 Tax=Nakamurella sp. UYEF19 TaxID=1756392 RepID=UPI003390A678
MSFRAYLDNIEKNTGVTPIEFVELAHARGYDDPKVKTGVIIGWLAEDFGLGRGHAMALVHVIKNGARISDTHVVAAGPHSDASNTLELGGLTGRRAG